MGFLKLWAARASHILRGPAGIGKSHALGPITEDAKAAKGAFGCLTVGNERFMPSNNTLRAAGFRPLISRNSHHAQPPRPEMQ